MKIIEVSGAKLVNLLDGVPGETIDLTTALPRFGLEFVGIVVDVHHEAMFRIRGSVFHTNELLAGRCRL